MQLREKYSFRVNMSISKKTEGMEERKTCKRDISKGSSNLESGIIRVRTEPDAL